MKKQFLCFLFGLFASLSLASCDMGFTVEPYENADQYVVGSQEYAGDLEELDIDWIFGSVTLVEDPSATKITLTEDNNVDDAIKVHSWYHDSKLSVKFGESGYHGGLLEVRYKTLTVTYAHLSNLKVTLTTGTLTADMIHASDCSFTMTAGEMEVGVLNASHADFTLTAGIVHVDEVHVSDIVYTMTTGTCKMGLFSEMAGSFQFTSGSVDLTIPDDTATQIILDRTTGKLKSDKAYTQVDNVYTFPPLSEYPIGINLRVQMTSGRLRIR